MKPFEEIFEEFLCFRCTLPNGHEADVLKKGTRDNSVSTVQDVRTGVVWSIDTYDYQNMEPSIMVKRKYKFEISE